MTLQQMRYFIVGGTEFELFQSGTAALCFPNGGQQQIKLLEEELETELFQRTRHSVALTSAGQVFYEYAVRITDLAEAARPAWTTLPKPAYDG